jgi:hypothetical protein
MLQVNSGLESMGIRNDGWLRLFLNRHLMEQRGPAFWLELALMMPRHSTILGASKRDIPYAVEAS